MNTTPFVAPPQESCGALIWWKVRIAHNNWESNNTTILVYCWIVTSNAVTNLPQGFHCDPRQRVLCAQGDHRVEEEGSICQYFDQKAAIPAQIYKG